MEFYVLLFPGGEWVPRPTVYTTELAEAICGRLTEGESLRKICADEGMPNKSTVLRWLANAAHAAFRDQYARARELQADLLADEIIEIADDDSEDIKLVASKDGGPPVEIVNHENIQRSRLRVDARKWTAARLAPKRYGGRLINEQSSLGGKPIQTQAVPAPTPEQIRADLYEIFGAAAVPNEPAAADLAGSDPPAADGYRETQQAKEHPQDATDGQGGLVS
jgi:hypothetical protein